LGDLGRDGKAAFLKEAALSRGDLTDAEWRILDPLLPDRGERGPPLRTRRRTVNGILWVLRTGAPWRDMPERYGNWNSVFVRFSCWSKLGVRDAAFETPGQRGIDYQKQEALGRSRGGFSSKIHLRTNANGDPLTFDVTGGEAHEVKGYEALIELHHVAPDRLLGDKG
jgi:hypothetical protein